MKIHIFGASGTGTTVLGKAIAEKLAISYLDSDDYTWQKTTPPFQTLNSRKDRNGLLTKDLSHYKAWVLSGSVITWDDLDIPAFDLAVYLYVPTEIRLQRIRQREELLVKEPGYWNPARRKNFDDFIIWTSDYDTKTIPGRSRLAHEKWIAETKVPVLEIRGDTTVSDRVARVMERLAMLDV